jgi:hypothetical protein
LGGQFGPVKGGQFAPVSGGLFAPVSGGHFERFFQHLFVAIMKTINAILVVFAKPLMQPYQPRIWQTIIIGIIKNMTPKK